ncbi:terminase small subunit [Xanthobacter aminoxidans]|uniref:terminase small subunit n=1 Tax=Xanthobacter aminoxidans TaxID=186280 RepID=UPI00372A4BAC
MTPKQSRFVAEYLIDLNATQAAIRAGYSKRTARFTAAENLAKPYIAAEVKQAMAERAARTEITADRVLKELAKIGFSDIRNVVTWGEAIAVKDIETGEVTIANGVALVAADQLDESVAATIAEVSQTKDGTLKVKLHDKRAALVDIGRHLGMFNDKLTLKGDAENPLTILVQQLQGSAIKPVEIVPVEEPAAVHGPH